MNDYYPPPSSLPRGSVVWAYLRDSGGNAQERSVDQQENAIRDYCREYGLVLEKSFCDVAKSGGSLKGREEFQRMIEMTELERLRPDGILVWNNARFGRNVGDAQYHRSLIRKMGVIYHSMTDPIPEGNVGIVTEAVIDFSNQEKREQMSRDIKRGKRDQMRRGYKVGGTPPRGYQTVREICSVLRDGEVRMTAKWIPDPDLWDLCKLAWKLRAEGASYQEIQKATKGLIYNSKSSWNSFFRNKTYLGVGKCGDLEISGHHEALIDGFTWERVQALRRGHPRFGQSGHINAPRRISNPSLLSGLAVCAYCGDAMVISRDRRKNWACYKCGRKNRQGKDSCRNRQINARKVDALVLNTVFERVLTLNFVREIFQKVREEVSGTNELRLQIERVKNAQNLNDTHIDRLIRMGKFSGVNGRIEKELAACDVKAQQLANESRNLETKLQASKVEISDQALEYVLAKWREKICQAQKEDDLARLRKLISNFVAFVDLGYNLENERITRIWYQFPIDESTIPANRMSVSRSTLWMPVTVGSWALEVEWSDCHAV